MAKNLVIGGFLATLVVAFSVFFTRDKGTPRDVLAEGKQAPRLILDEFSFFRYKGANVEANFSAKLGHFIEPNVIEVFASVRGVRYRGDQVETMRCESGSAVLDADSMT